MAKKRRIKETDEKKTEQVNISITDESQIITVEELETIKKYEPLQLSFKFHLILFISLFALFSLIFWGYLKIVETYAQEKINEGLIYLQIAEKLNKEDTGALEIYQESEDYQLLNKLHQNINRDISYLLEISKVREVSDEMKVKLEETLVLLPEIHKVLNKRAAEKFQDIKINVCLKKFEQTSQKLSKEIAELFKINENIKKSDDKKKYANTLRKRLNDISSTYFELENYSLRFRSLWNRAAGFDAALELFQRAINLDNKSIQSYYYLGKIYDIMEEPELAGERYVMVIKLKLKSKLAQEVFEKFKKSVEADPENLQHRYNLGMAYYWYKQKDKAKAEFNFIVGKDPNLKSYLAFMADKRIKEMDNPTPEVIYNPRI